MPKIAKSVPGIFYDGVAVWMLSIGRNRIRLTTAVGRSWICRRVPCHIGERNARVLGSYERAPVVPEAVIAVVKGTAQVHDVGFSRR